MSWVQQVHNAAIVARSLGCQCDKEMPTGRTLTDSETWECGNPLRLLPLRVRVGYSGDYLGYSGDYPATSSPCSP